jgi:hypothetical protein
VTVDRRTTLRWAAVVAAGAGATFGGIQFFGRDREDLRTTVSGYGKDPLLTSPPRDAWPLRLKPAQRAAVKQLADLVLPGDPAATPACPAASTLDIDAFFDEWLSAPYPEQAADHALLMPLLNDVARAPANASSIRRKSKFTEAAARFRVLATAAYYTTAEGLSAIGFVGNEARAEFEAPPAELVRRFEQAFAKLHP